MARGSGYTLGTRAGSALPHVDHRVDVEARLLVEDRGGSPQRPGGRAGAIVVEEVGGLARLCLGGLFSYSASAMRTYGSVYPDKFLAIRTSHFPFVTLSAV